MVSPDAVNVAQHWAIQNPTDPLPFLLQPRQNQCLNHLLVKEGRSQGLTHPFPPLGVSPVGVF